MKLLIIAIAIFVFTPGAEASDKSRQDAVAASAFYLALATSCEATTGRAPIEAALADMPITLSAAGFSAAEATSKVDEIKAALAAKPATPAAPQLCIGMLKTIADQRAGFRAKLATE